MTTNDDEAWVAALRGKSVANTDEAARLEAGELRRAMLDAHATRAAAEGSNPEELQRLLFRLRREQLLDAAELRPETVQASSGAGSRRWRATRKMGFALAAVLVLSITVIMFRSEFRDSTPQAVADLQTKNAASITPNAIISVLVPPPGMVSVNAATRYPSTVVATFDLGSTSLTVQARERLDLVGPALNDAALAKYDFVLEGLGEPLSGNEWNIGLGQARAQAVRNYLVSRGVNAERLVVRVVRGPADPLANRSVHLYAKDP